MVNNKKKVRFVEIDDKKPAPIQRKPEAVNVRGKSIYLAVPCYGCQLHNSFLTSLLSFQIEAVRRGVAVFIDLLGNESLIQRARNILTARFLKSPATHMLFIDADLEFHPNTIFRMLEFGKDVVSCAYPKKATDFDRVVSKVLAGDEEAKQCIHGAGLDYNINIAEDVTSVNGFIPVLDAATGFLLLTRHAVEKVCKAYDPELRVVNDIMSSRDDIPEYIDIFECTRDPIGDQGQKRLLSEDYAFSRKCQAQGLTVYMDIVSTLGHSGGTIMHGDIRTRFRKKTSYEMN
jgi:hypothetical protein